MSKVCAIVPAAGFGRRMKNKCPKQYIYVGDKTILEHSVATLLANNKINSVVIVINPVNANCFAVLSLADNPKIKIVEGGTERYYSVLHGIQAAKDATWVLVHDAARPCLHESDLIKLMRISNFSKIGGILATPVRDTIKRASFCNKTMTITNTVERTNLWHALTPQFFPRKLLYDCLINALNKNAKITDEASALEYCGFHPKLIKGRLDNIKVTYPEDLQLAEFYLTKNKFFI